MASSVNPEELVRPRGFSHGMLAAPGQRVLAIAGQIGWDGAGVMATGFAAQFAQTLRNLLAVVRQAGGQETDVLSLRIYVTDLCLYKEQLTEVGRCYREIFGRHYPAMALIQVAGLLEAGALVAIEGLAAVQGPSLQP